MTRLVHGLLGALFGLLCALPSSEARAQSKLAAAEALFKEGRALMQAGNADAACLKFAESQRLDPSAGTALNLAQCYEHVGKTASAWAQYLVARRIGQAQEREPVVAEATKKAAELEPKLSHLLLQISEPVEGLTVVLGETQLEPAAVGSKIPVDPGDVVVRVSAPGYQDSTTEVHIPERGETRVVIPALLPEIREQPVDAPAFAPPTRSEPPPDAGHERPDRTWAYVLGGVGLAALGTGVGLGFAAKSKNDEARELCGGGTSGCPLETMGAADDADTLATAGTIVGGVGLVSLALGAVLYFTAEPANESLASAPRAPHVRLGGAVLLRGAAGRDAAMLTLQGGF